MDTHEPRFFNRYHESRTGILCCACIGNVKGSVIACLIWAGFSFYFATLAFMQQSPFYSYLDNTLLIVSGVVNLIYGLVSLIVFFVTILRTRFKPHRTTAYVMGFCTIMVLADTLVNFIMFAQQKDQFQSWCENAAKSAMKDVILPPNTTLDTSSDTYNCTRLYNDEVKWGLLSVTVMFVFYIHWTLVVASAIGTHFYPMLMPLRSAPAVQNIANLAPSKMTEPTSLSNIRPRSLDPLHQTVDMTPPPPAFEAFPGKTESA